MIANGDIASIEDAGGCLRRPAPTAVMIGRAAVGRPWLVGQIAAALDGRRVREPSDDEKTEAAIEHYEGLLSLFGRGYRPAPCAQAPRRLRRRGARGRAGVGETDRLTLVTTTEPAVAIAILRRLYEPAGERRAAA